MRYWWVNQNQTFTQEVRLTSKGGGAFEWMVGVFYTEEDAMQAQLAWLGQLDGSDLPPPYDAIRDFTPIAMLTRNTMVLVAGANPDAGTAGYQPPSIRLAKPARQISLYAVVEAMEGRLGMTECSGDHGQCELEATCGIQGHWQRINDVIADALRAVSVAELGQSGRKSIPLSLAKA